MPVVDRRAVTGRHIDGVDQILDGDRDAVKRTAGPFAVALPGRRQRLLAIEILPGADHRLPRVDLLQPGGGIVLGGKPPRRDLARRRAYAQRCRIGHRPLPRSKASTQPTAAPRRAGRAIEPLAGTSIGLGSVRTVAGNHDDDEGGGSRRGAVIGLVVTGLIVVAGYFLMNALRNEGKVEDCLMSGRTNCAPLDIPTHK